MNRFFDVVYIINLKIRTDRLQEITSRLPRSICDVKIWEAVHGDTVRAPRFWSSGYGAWGCYRSHAQILEHAIQHKYKSYLVLEDDAVFVDDFDDRLAEFMNALPSDWQQIYLGGQLLHEIPNPPTKINDLVYMPYNVNRTHAFGVHQRGYYDLYDHLYSLPFAKGEHIDHHLGRLHESGKFSVYVPARWIVGQSVGSSNVSGQTRNDHEFWPDPVNCATDHWLLDNPVCVYLEAPEDVAALLHARGWHFGNWLNEEGLDNGVCEAIKYIRPEKKLKSWFDWVAREVVRDKKVIPCLYHPRLSIELVNEFQFAQFIHIKTTSVNDAIDQLTQAMQTIKDQDHEGV